MSDGPFYTAERTPNTIEWRPVTKRDRIDTDHGPIIVWPGVHVEMRDPVNDDRWGNRAEDFIRRHKLTGEALAVFKRHYPNVEIPDA